MTEEEFVEKIHFYTRNAKNLIEGNSGYNIHRGMTYVTSGYVEDLFALYLAKKLNRMDLQYLVDKVTSIRFSKNGKATTFKPDIRLANEFENVELFVLNNLDDAKSLVIDNLNFERLYTEILNLCK